MLDEVGFAARRPARWAEHVPAGHVEVDHEQGGAVALVFELPSGDLARTGGRSGASRSNARMPVSESVLTARRPATARSGAVRHTPRASAILAPAVGVAG